jgi:hypothetical protein
LGGTGRMIMNVRQVGVAYWDPVLKKSEKKKGMNE